MAALRDAVLDGVINKGMRYREINEAKMTDGVWTDLTKRDLIRFAKNEQLRGSVVNNRVYVWPALERSHIDVRFAIGLPNRYGDGDYGFDFYVYDMDTYEPDQGSEEWVNDGVAPNFQVGNIGISDNAGNDAALDNSGFRRMIGY